MVIERKAFSVGWTGIQGRNVISVMEKSKKRTVRGFVSKECLRWIVSSLCKHAEAWKNNALMEAEERR